MATDSLEHLHGVAVLRCAPDGPKIAGDREATDLIGDAFSHEAELVELPIERLTDDFFDLRTGVAGLIVQKFVNYRVRLAVIGDISPWTAQSSALEAFVTESNRGRQLWFLLTPDALAQTIQRTA